MALLAALLIASSWRQAALFQLDSGRGAAEVSNGTLHIAAGDKGGGAVAEVRIGKKKLADWKVSLKLKRGEPGAVSSDIILNGAESPILDLKVAAGKRSVIHFPGSGDVGISQSFGWHTVDLYSVDGLISIVYDGSLEASVPATADISTLTIGNPDLKLRQTELFIKDFTFSALSESDLDAISYEVPRSPGWKDVDLDRHQTLRGDLEQDDGVAVPSRDLGIIVHGSEAQLKVPPASKLTFWPEVRTSAYKSQQAFLFLDGVQYDSVTLGLDLDSFHGIPAEYPTNGGGHVFTMMIIDDHGRQHLVQTVGGRAISGPAPQVRASISGDDVTLTCDEPIKGFYLYAEGRPFGFVKSNGPVGHFNCSGLTSGDYAFSVLPLSSENGLMAPSLVQITVAKRLAINLLEDVPEYVCNALGGSLPVEISAKDPKAVSGIRVFLDGKFAFESKGSTVTGNVLLCDQPTGSARLEVQALDPGGNPYGEEVMPVHIRNDLLDTALGQERIHRALDFLNDQTLRFDKKISQLLSSAVLDPQMAARGITNQSAFMDEHGNVSLRTIKYFDLLRGPVAESLARVEELVMQKAYALLSITQYQLALGNRSTAQATAEKLGEIAPDSAPANQAQDLLQGN